MFAQIIQGRTTDAEGLRDRMEEWDRSLKPGATGFLGSTGGVSDDGDAIVIARFESEDAARRNSDRPEQGEWWTGTEKYFEGDVRFYDSTEVEESFGGGSDDAGFVQVIQGKATDKQRLREMEASAEEWMRANRPDVIGSVRAWQGDDFTEFVYFKSEAEAREGESKNFDQGDQTDEWSNMMSDVKFIDLRSPFFSSP